MTSESIQLVRALLRLVHEPVDSTWLPFGAEILRRASPQQWQYALSSFQQRNLVGAQVGHALAAHNLGDCVPPTVMTQFSALASQAIEKNHRLSVELSRLLAALPAEGVTPIVLKSTALAVMYPEHMVAHGMRDIDLLIRPGELPLARTVLSRLGYSPGVDSRDATHFDLAGQRELLDLHTRFRIYEGRDMAELTIDLPSYLPTSVRVRVFEPHAMLVHLLTHFNEHRSTEGYVLRSLLDLALIVRKIGPELQPHRLNGLVRDSRARCWLLRLLQLLEHDLGVAWPLALLKPTCALAPISLAEMLRSHRLAYWRLRTPRGWLGLAACLTGVKNRNHRSFPRPSDFPLQLRDLCRERSALRRTPASLEAHCQSGR